MVASGLFLDHRKVSLFFNCLASVSFLKFVNCPVNFKWSQSLHMVFFADGLVRRFIRGDEGVSFDRPSLSYDPGNFVPVEVKAGSLVVIHGDLVHQRLVKWKNFLYVWLGPRISFSPLFLLIYVCCSFVNQSSKSRHAYSLHVVDTDGCKWSPENW